MMQIVLNENDIGNLHSSKCCCRLERKDGHKCIIAFREIWHIGSIS